MTIPREIADFDEKGVCIREDDLETYFARQPATSAEVARRVARHACVA